MKTLKKTAWFWGEIHKKWRTSGRYFSYAIKFDDGDVVNEIGSKNLMGYEEYQRHGLSGMPTTDDPKIPKNINDERKRPANVTTSPNKSGIPYTPKELYDNRCQDCVLCRRQPCGLCDVCASDELNVCCYQKVRVDRIVTSLMLLDFFSDSQFSSLLNVRFLVGYYVATLFQDVCPH
jgi:hypothetical protein